MFFATQHFKQCSLGTRVKYKLILHFRFRMERGSQIAKVQNANNKLLWYLYSIQSTLKKGKRAILSYFVFSEEIYLKQRNELNTVVNKNWQQIQTLNFSSQATQFVIKCLLCIRRK